VKGDNLNSQSHKAGLACLRYAFSGRLKTSAGGPTVGSVHTERKAACVAEWDPRLSWPWMEAYGRGLNGMDTLLRDHDLWSEVSDSGEQRERATFQLGRSSVVVGGYNPSTKKLYKVPSSVYQVRSLKDSVAGFNHPGAYGKSKKSHVAPVLSL
jgi:hypothetical protein